MTEIKVLISGMILFVAPIGYPTGTSSNINAAVAVEAQVPEKSKYDVDIPPHGAFVSVPASVVKTANIADPNGRVRDEDNNKVVDLHGDVVQFGTFNSGTGTCDPMPDGDQATLGASMTDLVHITEVAGNQKLETYAHPDDSSGMSVFTGMHKDLVAGWMEIPKGSLRAIHSDKPSEDRVEFRPGGKERTTVKLVRWVLSSGTANCMAVTPFSGADRISIPFKDKANVRVEYKNVREDEDPGDATPGVAYDFELFYQIVDAQPAFPPIPYALEIPARKAGEDVHGGTGVNCGPAQLP